MFTSDAADEAPTGSGVEFRDAGPNARFKFYTSVRPGPIAGLRAVEIVLDVTIIIDRPVRAVWPVFKDFDRWMGRYGFVWHGLPAHNEDRYVHASSDADTTSGVPPTRYIVRRVIAERLIYFDSLPMPIGGGKKGVWTGHNVMCLHEESGCTTISIFMEHTWYSESMTVEELRREAKAALDEGLVFWDAYFIPDLCACVELEDAHGT